MRNAVKAFRQILRNAATFRQTLRDPLMQRLGVFIATCGYLGYVPIAPGTFGSAAGLAVFYLVRSTGSVGVEIAAILVLFAVGVWSGTVAEQHFGGIDPGPVVLDEVVGMLITLALLPVNVTG